MNASLQAFLDAMVNDDGTGTTGDLMDKTWWADLLGRLDTVISLAGLSVETDQTYYVSTTGSDTTGNGSLTLPWATIGHALTNLRAYRIAPGSTVTVQVDDGAYTLTAPLTDTPAGLTITGKTSMLRAITSIQAVTGSTGDLSIELNIVDMSSIAVGDECAITEAANGTAPLALCGVFPITAIDALNSRITIHAPILTGLAPSGAVTAVARIFKTRLVASGVTALRPNTPATFRQLALVGDQTADTSGVSPLDTRVRLEYVAIRNFGSHAVSVADGAHVEADGVYLAFNAGSALSAATGGVIAAANATLARNQASAIACGTGGSITAPSVVSVYAITPAGTTVRHVECDGSGTVMIANAVLNRGYIGIDCQLGGVVEAPYADIRANHIHAIYCDGTSIVNAAYAVIADNDLSLQGLAAVVAYNAGTIMARGASITGTEALGAHYLSFIDARDAVISGAVSPAVNTEGNTMSYIRTT